MTRFKHPRNSALVAAVWLACCLFPSMSRALEPVAAPPKPVAPGAANATSGLTSAQLYEILVGEFSAQAGDYADAYQLLLDAARKTASPALYERSVEIALRARAGDSALEAAQAWAHAFPEAPEGHRFVLQILLGMNRVADTVEPIRYALAHLDPARRLVAIDDLPRYFSRVADKKSALKAVETALAPELSSVQAGAAAYAAIGTMRILAEDTDGALDAIKKGMTLNPQATEPGLLALGLLDARLPGAEDLLQRYLQTPGKPEIRMAYVRKLLETQRYAEATTQVMQLTTATPGNSLAYRAWL